MNKVKEIVNKWYDEMKSSELEIPAKATTILFNILSEYKITDVTEVKDIWAEFLTINGGQFADWYENLSEKDKAIFHEQRKKAKKSFHSKKSLLKG
tara:strand:+ start:1089 stop:1376 length:288 start_codon:yes stop_codon:yes gene_type:complete